MTLGVSWTVQHRSLLTDNDRTKRDHYARHKRHNPAPFGNGHVHIGRNHNAPARGLGESNSIKFMTADETKRFTRSPRIMLFLSGQTKPRKFTNCSCRAARFLTRITDGLITLSIACETRDRHSLTASLASNRILTSSFACRCDS